MRSNEPAGPTPEGTDVNEFLRRHDRRQWAITSAFWRRMWNQRLYPPVPVERGSYRPAGWDPLAEEG